jgi:hypothetical protein
MQVLVKNITSRPVSFEMSLDNNGPRSIRRMLAPGQTINIGDQVDPYEINRNAQVHRQVTLGQITVTFAADATDFIPVPGPGGPTTPSPVIDKGPVVWDGTTGDALRQPNFGTAIPTFPFGHDIYGSGPGTKTFVQSASGSKTSGDITTTLAGHSGRIEATAKGAQASGHIIGSTSSAPQIRAIGLAARAHGYAKSSGYIRATGKGADAGGYASQAYNYAAGHGAFMRVFSTGPGSYTHVDGKGASVLGAVVGDSTIEASGVGAQVVGYAKTSAVMEASGFGARVDGYARDTGGYIKAVGTGANAGGFVFSGANIYAGGTSFVRGYIGGKGSVSLLPSRAYAYGDGSILIGCALAAFDTGQVREGVLRVEGQGASLFGYAKAGGYVKATAQSAHVRGYAHGSGSYVYAVGNACWADGLARGGGGIKVGGASSEGNGGGGYAPAGRKILIGTAAGVQGAFGWGFATGADIIANADNAQQFGPGTNTEPNTLSTGTRIRLKGTTGAPGTLRNGDVWEASGYVYIRSNGVSVKIV